MATSCKNDLNVLLGGWRLAAERSGEGLKEADLRLHRADLRLRGDDGDLGRVSPLLWAPKSSLIDKGAPLPQVMCPARRLRTLAGKRQTRSRLLSLLAEKGEAKDGPLLAYMLAAFAASSLHRSGLAAEICARLEIADAATVWKLPIRRPLPGRARPALDFGGSLASVGEQIHAWHEAALDGSIAVKANLSIQSSGAWISAKELAGPDHESGGRFIPSGTAEWRSLEGWRLAELVWETPRSSLAGRFKVSDQAIRKRCIHIGIQMPPRGYWAKVRSGATPDSSRG
jgi:hypothetical protein